MVYMLTPAASSDGWDVKGSKVTEAFNSDDESRLVNKGLAIYAMVVAGSVYETDENGIIQISLIGLLEDLL